MNKDIQYWSNSNLTEMEELLQKVQQLETENAALHRLIDDPNAMHSHYLRKCNGWEVWQAERIHWFQDTVDKLERENAALLKEIAPLRETVGVRGDAVTSRDDIDYWSKLVDRADKAVRLETENVALREELQQSEDRFRNIPDEVWSKADLVEMTNKALEERDDAYKQNAALREENRKAHDMACEDAVERYRLNGENAALRNEMASLKHQTQWECSCGGTDCEGQKENAELRGDLEEALFERDEVKRVRYSLEDALTRSQAEAEACWVKKERLADAAEKVLKAYINVVAMGTNHPCPENLAICRQLRAAIDASRKEAKP